MKRLFFIALCLAVSIFTGTLAIAENISITSEEAAKLIEKQQSNITILDIRTKQEYATGHIKSAKLIDYYSPQFEAELKELDRNAPYVIYCRSGARTSNAFELMKRLGFTNVYNMQDGIRGWLKNSLPLEKDD